jgi:O-antigen/teichoic acid export membrane protein
VYLLYLVAFACGIIILIHAFTKEGVGWGLACLCIPFVIIYYMFAKFEHEKKGLILAGYWGGAILGVIFVYMGGGLDAPAS